MRRGKNTNNTLAELKWVHGLMDNGKFNYDGRHAENARKEVEDDIKELES